MMKASEKLDMIKKLSEKTGVTKSTCQSILIDSDWDYDSAYFHIRKKQGKPKEKKVFNVGDTVVCVDNKPGKNMPEDCIIFINTYKYFVVKDVNDKLNIDLGHKLVENGNPYYFSPNRFELKDGKAPTRILGEENPKEETVAKTPEQELIDKVFGGKSTISGKVHVETQPEPGKATLPFEPKLNRFQKFKKELEKEKEGKEEKEEEIKRKLSYKSDSDEDWDFELMK